MPFNRETFVDKKIQEQQRQKFLDSVTQGAKTLADAGLTIKDISDFKLEPDPDAEIVGWSYYYDNGLEFDRDPAATVGRSKTFKTGL